MDLARMAHAVLSPFRRTLEEKMVVGKAIEDAGIPHTYISANCCAGYFVGGLCQPKTLLPPRDRIYLHGDGGIKAVFVYEDDVGTYTIKAADDPRTLNKTLYLRPPENIMSQMEMVEMWEKLMGKRLEKTSISEEDFLASRKSRYKINFCFILHRIKKEKEMEKSRVLIVGGSGYIGRRLVKASLALGHPTYVLQRREIGLDIEKIEILLNFKQQGARLVEASFFDHQSLVEAVKLVDVVVCAVSGVHHRGHSVLMQLKLVDAIKEAGNIKRFVPSEFGMDPAHMASVVLPNRKTIEDKMVVRKAIVDAGIPTPTAGYFVGSLCQGKTLIPPRDRVYLHGDGGIKAVFVAEDDVGTYTIKAVDDPQTLNKTLYLRPPENIMSQIELVKIWENLMGKRLEKISISEEEFLASKKSTYKINFCFVLHMTAALRTVTSPADETVQATIDLYYHIFHEGRLTNFEIGEDEEEASNLYPEVVYTRVEDYLKRYL
ncbi:hypothetical protein EJ110_NYTH33830 [Nymphaea thermarum]|nr:hypothetical protein EJ110_NYTH33830 [Nymphaea thermarum]